MIQQERTPELVNRLSNLSGNLKYLTRHGNELDWSPAFPSIDSNTIVLSNGEDACMVLERADERAWQANTIFGPTCRGRAAVNTGLEMRDWMRPYADWVFGSVPKDFKHAIWFYRKLGGIQIPVLDTGAYIYTPQNNEVLLALDLRELN